MRRAAGSSSACPASSRPPRSSAARPSSAHAEALLRAIEFKGAAVDEPLDAIVIGIPPTTLFLPRSRPNPVAAAHLGLGLALRLWRNTFPVREGGTAILLHDFLRRFPAPTQTPYRALFSDPRTARDREAVGEAERLAAADTRGLAEYRAGRTVHPLEPFVAWSACDAVANRLGSVLVAGLPRRRRRAAARLRPGGQRRRRPRHGARNGREANRLPALAARTSRSWSAAARTRGRDRRYSPR